MVWQLPFCWNQMQVWRKKKQVVSFGGKTCGWSQEALRKLGEKCIEKLNDGKDPEEVKKWAREEVKGE